MGSGILSFPLDVTVKCFFKGIMGFLEDLTENMTSIRKMNIIIWEQEKAEEFLEEWEKLFEEAYEDDEEEREQEGNQDSDSDDDQFELFRKKKEENKCSKKDSKKTDIVS
mmetsp:Transcript_10090/g.11488  ORF Transcript_10090/g.11488 Transcript_10090/m.11488 type:complete len:110 (+) Transcript_10090:459-788(+)